MIKSEYITDYVLQDPINPFLVDETEFLEEDVQHRAIMGEDKNAPYSYIVYYTDGYNIQGRSTVEPDNYVDMVMKGVLNGDPNFLEIDSICGCGFDENGKQKGYFTYDNDSFKLRNLGFPVIGREFPLDSLSDSRKYLYLSYLIENHKSELAALFHLEEKDLGELQKALVKANEDAERLDEIAQKYGL